MAKQEVSEIDRELELLEAELKRLEAEYNMFFAGRLPRPPWETRGRVTAMVRRLDNLRIPNTGGKFRFNSLQSRFQTFADLWDRGLKAREEGRPGPAHRQQQRGRHVVVRQWPAVRIGDAELRPFGARQADREIGLIPRKIRCKIGCKVV